ncbi:hypothetical protein CTI12_AA263960 [Artemisia annua]|uniref:Uncharacterized protein n=1 Tax=Artemisia annua TaxID=35608 RepID=A0A2U1NI30_ARTAN|nr:hypothetical protein CTI12_AA263960 [Artemisia annua]
MAKLRLKLARVASRHDQLKLSFNHLKSHIETGLLEAEDVFSSLAVPLVKIVGLKTAQMAKEGRSSTIFMNTGFNFQDECEETCKSFSSRDKDHGIRRLEEDYTHSAIKVSKELIHKKKDQLIQLMQLLKQIEGCVNSSQKSIFQTIDGHKDNIHTYLQKAVTYVSAVQQQSSHDGHAYNITLKLLKAIYVHVCEILSSVEGGVDSLINKLTEQMCQPMIEYARSFKAEITSGTCPRLLATLEAMKGVTRDGRVELEQARKMVRVAEEKKREALGMLKESEERMKKMRQYMESTGHSSKNKLLAPQEDQVKDDKLLWELLKKKQTRQQPASPFGPKELLQVGTSTRQHQSMMGNPSITHRPTTRAYGKLNAHSLGSLLPLGSSPSVTRSQVLSRKR